MPNKLGLEPKYEKQLEDCARTVREILGSHAESLELTSRQTAGSAMASLFRPYLMEMFVSGEEKTGADAARKDQREREWDVRCYIWQFWEGEEASDALLADNETPDRVHGLNGVASLVREYVEMHDIEPDDVQGIGTIVQPFSKVELRRRMASLRPAINRGGGTCSSRWDYAIKGESYTLQVDIKRVD